MANTIAGSLPISQIVDQNGSLCLRVPLQVPHAKLMPDISLAYHSAANTPSSVGRGWSLQGASTIERVPATVAQDGLRGVVNYDANDRFALDGQRLIRLSATGNEYRFEIERWSKVVAFGSNDSNPDYWVEHLPNGTKRTFGYTADSNIKAQGGTATRVWAICDHSDVFSNYISFAYDNDSDNGSFYLTAVTYGGNRGLNMAHQRQVGLQYEDRTDTGTTYLGGYKISLTKRLASITSYVSDKLVHNHVLHYDTAPLTSASRLHSVTLADSSGATVLPLTFGWVNGDAAVFSPLQNVTTIAAGTTSADIIPLDVNGTGRNDFLIASKRLDSKSNEDLYLATYAADGQGGISQSASPGSGFTGLGYPTQLLPLDHSGSGKQNLLHIKSSVKDSSFTLTILLSTANGYVPQDSLVYKPKTLNGYFYTGDFEGSGCVGLVYIYQVMKSGNPQLKFVQFTSDGSNLTALSVCDGPSVGLDNTQVVVGDLNGKGAEDVFLISSKLKKSKTVCRIDLLASSNAQLTYCSDGPLRSVGESVSWTDSTSFLPYSADYDGKTGLLVVSKATNGNLTWQLLRSSGPSLLSPSSVTTTDVPYQGNVTLARATTTSGVDLINTFEGTDDIKIHVLRFDGENFVVLDDVTQPTGVATGSPVRWADLRGIGRVDCTLNTFDTSGNVTIQSMPCSSSQPVDHICSFENGLGAKFTMVYASLSDPQTYSTTKETSQTTLPAVNAMACNVASAMSLTASADIQTMGRSRVHLVHFPAFVVKTITRYPHATQSQSFDCEGYTYVNARLDFLGRGWLGFESITKSLQPLGTLEQTTYGQTFPLIRRILNVVAYEAVGEALLQVNDYTWDGIQINNGANQSVRLVSSREGCYETGAHSYDVDVSYQYDSYAQITQLDIKSSQPNVSTLSIQSTYDSDEETWTIGNKTLEVVKQQGTVLKQTKFQYVPGSQVSSSISKWVADSTWSTQSFEFDGAGNESVVKGPGLSRRELTYDATYSYIASALTFTGSDKSTSLKETAVFDLALAKPLLVTSPNGHIVSRTYDALGRELTVSKGDNSGMYVVERNSFGYQNSTFFHLQQVWAGTSDSDNNWASTKSYIDGCNQTWRVEKSRPDDLSAVICSDSFYDGAGRLVASSRDYLAGSTPAFNQYAYDTRARVVKKLAPPVEANLSAVATTYQYKYESGVGMIIETRSGGTDVGDQTTTRSVTYLPNPKPSVGKFVQPFVTHIVNPLGEEIRTIFDGIGRPISIKDPADVELSLQWDGLSRQVDQCISQPTDDASKMKTISHFSIKHEDDLCQTTARNELTGSTTKIVTDYAQRMISKTTPDETLTFSYDSGGKCSKERLVNVSSSNGITHQFDYNIQGHLTQTSLSLNKSTFTTSYEWSPAGQLLKTTNPDGTTVTRSFLPDGRTVKGLELADVTQAIFASVDLSSYDNPYSQPLVCDFGNGAKSTMSVAYDGTPTNAVLSHGSNKLHQQTWTLDSFSRIGGYTINHSDTESVDSFGYDTSGQLVKCTSSDSDSSSTTTTDHTFSYDTSGNLLSNAGRAFINTGWQLDSIKGSNGETECSFKYSVDGNRTAKLDANGDETSVMKYDTQGRLINLDGTIFDYDFNGRLIKSTLPNGDYTIYPSQTYELDFSSSDSEVTHTAYLNHGHRRASLAVKETEDQNAASSSTVYYFHSDHLGSTVAATDADGDVVVLYKYDSLGKVSVDGLDVARYKFQGKELFGELYYFGARFYDPDAGRFLTLDNILPRLHHITPSSFNMYTFSQNDPINFIDFNGNLPVWAHYTIDAALILAGLALFMVPIPGFMVIGGFVISSALAGVVLGVAVGACVGAGVSGLLCDLSSDSHESSAHRDSEWAKQLGLGAAFGALSGGVGVLVDAAVPAVSLSEAWAVRGLPAALGRKAVFGFLGRTAIRFTLMSAAGSGVGVLQQIVTNITNRKTGRDIFDDVGTAAWQGAAAGAAMQVFFEAGSFIRANRGLPSIGGRAWRAYHIELDSLPRLPALLRTPNPMEEIEEIGIRLLHFDSEAVRYNSATAHIEMYFNLIRETSV